MLTCAADNSGLQADFAEQSPSEGASTRAIYHSTRPVAYSPSSSSNASNLPRLAALRNMSYRDQRLELGGVNTHRAQEIAEWQNSTDDVQSESSEEPWATKEDQTSVTESTVAEDMMEEQKSEGSKETADEESRRKLLLEKGKHISL
jgi:hypothetical protein